MFANPQSNAKGKLVCRPNPVVNAAPEIATHEPSARFSTGTAELFLPFAEGNSNPGGALHGGVYASLTVTAAQEDKRQNK